ncbi:hypothetical protein [Streptomyces avermitilis]|uniref:hypothetical protein n=1 Tax=Streptomyces avermitilis TaxID=33903 RepID=UPI0036CDDFD2
MAGKKRRAVAQELREHGILVKESSTPGRTEDRETPGSLGSALRRIRSMGSATAMQKKAVRTAIAPIVRAHGGPKALGLKSLDQVVDRILVFAEHVGYNEYSLHQLLNSKGGTYQLFRGYLWEITAPHNLELRNRQQLAAALTVGSVNAALSAGTAELRNGAGDPVDLRGQFEVPREGIHVEREVAPGEWKQFRDRITYSSFRPRQGHTPPRPLFLWPTETELKVSERGGAKQVAAGVPRTEASLRLRWIDEESGLMIGPIDVDQLIRDPAQLSRHLVIPKLDRISEGHEVRLGHGTYGTHQEDYIHVEADISSALVDALARALKR